MILAGMFGGSANLEARMQRLFNGGVPGVMFDWVHASNLYQDSARTTLVAANGDPIGSVTDLSGNNKHAGQATPTARAPWNSAGYAAPDGVDDWWITPNIDFTGTDKITIVCAVSSAVTSGAGMISEISASTGSFAGSFYVAAGADGVTGYTSLSRGAAAQAGGQRAGYAIAAPNTSVLVVTHDISGDLSTIEVNGVAAPPATADKGAGNFGNHPLYLLTRAGTGVFFKDKLYRYACIGRELTASERVTARAWANQPVGVM